MIEKNKEGLVVVIFGAMLAIFAVVITSVGVKAVYEQRLRVTTKVSRSLFLWSESGKWNTLLEGREAQVEGVGLISFGLLFAVWSIGLLVSRTKPLAEQPGPLSKLAALLFTTAVVFLFPPWSVAKSAFVATFWCSFTVWTVAMVAVISRGSLIPIVVALFVATLLVDIVAPLRSSGGAVLGLLVTMGALAQAMFVYQPWRKWVVEQNRRAEIPDD
jgi:hypothetical protein